MSNGTAPRRQRHIQTQGKRAAGSRPKEKAEEAMQAGAREYPAPPFPKQHQSKPGHESQIDPAPMYEAPLYRGSGKLQDKVALITGGHSGFGRAVAIPFAREGAHIGIVYLKAEEADAQVTKKSVEAEGRKCILIRGDVSRQSFSKKAVARIVKELGSLDILVNNAAFQVHTSQFEDLTAEHFDETLKTISMGTSTWRMPRSGR
jgi:hypothetical protein